MNGELLKEWMKANRVRPEELATMLFVSCSTVFRMMAGKKPGLSTIKALCKITGLSEDDLTKASVKKAS